jgi:hypothetical protein
MANDTFCTKCVAHVFCCVFVQTSMDWSALRDRIKRQIQTHLPRLVPASSPTRSLAKPGQDSDSDEATETGTGVRKATI